jgi:hypothetical protein
VDVGSVAEMEDAYNTTYFVENQATFRGNMSPPSSTSKNKRNKLFFHLLSRWFLGSFLYLEDGGGMFLRNV